MTEPSMVKWRKSTWSQETSSCVELVYAGLVRDSKNPAGPTLNVDLAGLLDAVKADRISQ